MRGRATRAAALALACLLAVVGCSSAVPVHPLGAGCTWPAQLDPQRDGLAVLAAPGPPGAPGELVLLDVATGAVRARCVGMDYLWPEPDLGRPSTGNGVQGMGSAVFPPVSPDWRFGLASAGIVELATGTVVARPLPGWRAMALPGEGRVLRLRDQEQPATAAAFSEHTNWCVAPRFDAPASECAALPGEGRGFPAVGRDGSVGWAPATEVPVELAQPGAVGLAGVVQTDGVRIVQLQLGSSSGDGWAVLDASGRAGLLGRVDFLSAPVAPGTADHPAWYTLDGLGSAGATGRLHVAASSWDDVAALGEQVNPVAYGAAVVEGGAAVVVALRSVPSMTAYFVRIPQDGPARVVASLPLSAAQPLSSTQPSSGPDGDTPTTGIGGMPAILAWPDPATSTDS